MSTRTRALLAARYGQDQEPELSIELPETLSLLLQHRSVRRFTDAPVTEEQLTAIIAAAQSASSSSNHQAYSIIEVRDPERKRRLRDIGRSSRFVPHAPVILLFVADWSRHRQLAERAGEDSPATGYLESTMVAVADAALAAQNASVAAAALGLGSCYLGSLRNEPDFMAEEYALPEGAVIVFGLAIGQPDPAERAGIKPRLPQRVVRHRERYAVASADDLQDYEETLAAYYRAYDRPHRWISIAIDRVRSIAGLHGREGMREAFARRGLPSK